MYSGYGAGKGCGGAHIKNRNCHGGDMTIPGIRKTLGGRRVWKMDLTTSAGRATAAACGGDGGKPR